MKYILAVILSLSILSVAHAQSQISNVATNTNVQQAIVSILMGAKDVSGDIYNSSKDVIGQSVEFVKAQAPDLVKEFLRWKFTQALLVSLFGLFIIGVALFIGRWFIKAADGDADVEVPGYMIGIFGTLIGSALFIFWIMDVVQIAVAPRIYLLEYVVKIVQSHH
jgi:hypothetical protein